MEKKLEKKKHNEKRTYSEAPLERTRWEGMLAYNLLSVKTLITVHRMVTKNLSFEIIKL